MEGVIDIEELLELEEEHNFDYEDLDPDKEVCFSSDSESEDNVEIESEHENTSLPEPDMQPVLTTEKNGVKTFELKDAARGQIAQTLLILTAGKRVPSGKMKAIAAEYNVDRSTIHRIWVNAKKQMARGDLINVCSRKKSNCGRKLRCFDLELLCAVPVEKRTTIRALSVALGMSHSTVYRLLKTGHLRAHTNSIKPTLKHVHKKKRIEYILRQVIPGNVHTLPKFSAMYNVIHMDEKWFYMSKETQRFYLFPWDEDPYRAAQNKKFIGKVMFLGVIARPIIDANGNIVWDGKIGIFSFANEVPAQRSSKNRERGTVEKKAIQSITREIIRQKLIQEVLPAIRAKWAEHACKDIWLVQDNARPHISPEDHEFIQAATTDGINIQLTCQPAQSPDLNILDLGFFRAIQSIQYKAFPESVEDLVRAVTDAYNIFDPRTLNYTWLHLQYVMIEILKVHGGNNYKNPHHGKKRLERLGLLPTQVEVDQELLNATRDYLNEGHIQVNVMQNMDIDLNIP